MKGTLGWGIYDKKYKKFIDVGVVRGHLYYMNGFYDGKAYHPRKDLKIVRVSIVPVKKRKQV